MLYVFWRRVTGWRSVNGTTCDFSLFKNPRDELVINQSIQRCRFIAGREERKPFEKESIGNP